MAQVEIITANLKNNINNFVKKKKKKVCAYARVSTDSEEQLTSYSSQIKHYSDQIKSNPNWEFVGVYADEGISGTQANNRVEFMRMIDDALNGKIDIIIAKSISRFARNTLDTLKYARELRNHKIDVYFEKENIHTLDLDSEMFLTLYSAFAQAESESTSMNVKMGVRAKMKRGEVVGNPACYGYVWNKEAKELEINEEQAEVVRNIFNWYIDGMGTRAIARKLNELNIPSYKGIRWCQSAVRRTGNKKKDGSQNIYWACTTRQDKTDACKNSKFLRNNVIEEIFIQVYNSIIINKHKTKDKLLNAIKDTITNNDYKKKIDNLNNEKIKLEKRLSTLIDMKLDDYCNKELYSSKEKELSDNILKIVNEINEYQSLEKESNQISNHIDQIEEMLNEPQLLKEFDRNVFDSIVDRIIVGELDDLGNINSSVIRLVLKIGTEYRYDLINKFDRNKTVSFDSSNRKYCC